VNSERDARTDSLTRLPNRRAWDEQLQELHGPISVALIDVDGFKQINDVHGHAAGDAMLTLIGTILRNCNQVSAFRIGGDEFAMLISPEFAEHIAQRIRSKVASAVLQYEREKLSVTISIGIARRGDDEQWQSVLRRADDALYEEKRKLADRARSVELV
jgi:diguanylate cyclase (GGDEF)-like protein